MSQQRLAANESQVLKEVQRNKRIGIGYLDIVFDFLDAAQALLQLAANVT